MYRLGIGTAGNVDAGKISQLVTRPLGVSAVTNPLPATGGADRDDRDRARENAPLETLALDRLVSIRDYADFARTFAGIGKAVARRGIGKSESGVTITIAGEDDIPIDVSSDVYENLLGAFATFGDPCEPVALNIRALRPLVIGAAVRVLADYDWKLVRPKVVAALLDAFGFDRRDLGQGVYSSEVIAAMCSVPGVDFVDLQILDAVPAPLDPGALNDLGGSLHLHWQVPVRPDELCYLVASVPETLALSELVL